MAAILIYGWEVPDWAESNYAYEDDDDDYDFGVDIEEILPKNSSMTLECSKVGNHWPTSWVFGFKHSKKIAENGNCKKLNQYINPYDENVGFGIAKKYNIPIAGQPAWYLLDHGDD